MTCLSNHTFDCSPFLLSAKPYPLIQVSAVNIAYAQALMVDLASIKGELTAITQYQYQSWLLTQNQSSLAQCLSLILQTEIKHLDLLGQLIILLGGGPRFCTLQPKGPSYWHSQMTSYTTDIKKMLRDNLTLEQASINSYQYHLNIIKDPLVIPILQQIIEDEQNHLAFFKASLAQLES